MHLLACNIQWIFKMHGVTIKIFFSLFRCFFSFFIPFFLFFLALFTVYPLAVITKYSPETILFTCLFCMLVITRLFLVSEVSVEFIINLRNGELWKEVFIAKMHPLHPIFNSVLRIIIFVAQIVFKITYACKLWCMQNMAEIFIFLSGKLALMYTRFKSTRKYWLHSSIDLWVRESI